MDYFQTANKGSSWDERRGNLETLMALPGQVGRQALNKYYEDWLANGFDEVSERIFRGTTVWMGSEDTH